LDLAARAGAEGDHAVRGGEQGVVAADADVGARIHLGAPLADQDVAGEDLLAAEALHAQALAVGIAAVARGAACLFVCHLYSPVALTQATICSILTTVRSWRWPFLRREFWRRRFLKTIRCGPRACFTIEPTTLAPATVGEPTFSPTIRTSVNSTLAPASPAIRSTVSVSSAATVYCFPPVRITAIMEHLTGACRLGHNPPNLGIWRASSPRYRQTRKSAAGRTTRRRGAEYTQGRPQVNVGKPLFSNVQPPCCRPGSRRL